MTILISIIAGINAASSNATAVGEETYVIKDEERASFQIGTDQELKNAFGKLMGKTPDDIFLHSPTPWGDLYKTYNWPEVKNHISVKDITITEITSEPSIIATKTFENNSSQKAVYNTSISESMTNTIESSWTNEDKFSAGYTIKGSFSVLPGVVNIESGYTFNFDHSWGKGGSTASSTTLGSATGVSVELNPGEAVIAQLTATKGRIKVKVKYRAYLTGNVASNYSSVYKGHHFWWWDVNDVIAAAGTNNEKIITNDLEFGYYSNAKVIVVNKNSGVEKAATKSGGI